MRWKTKAERHECGEALTRALKNVSCRQAVGEGPPCRKLHAEGLLEYDAAMEGGN
jgi:hypothetical protein